MTIKIDARLQEAAIVLAEELHFGRAAQILHIAVSTLSKQIAQLEDKLGTKLFERSSKGVQLTEPGKAFVENARASLLQGERAVLLARAAKEGLDHILVVGHSPYTDPTLISMLLSIHLPLYPKLQVQLHSDFVFNLVHSLVTTELDMALIAWPPEGQSLTLVHVVTAALHVLLPEGHPAAQQDKVVLTDLKDDPWILFNKQAHPLLYDGILHRAEALGMQPKETHRIVTPDEAFHLVGEHAGVAFLAKAPALSHHHSGVIVKPLAEESLQLRTYLTLRANEPSRMVNEFARVFLRKCCGPNTDIQMKLPMPG